MSPELGLAVMLNNYLHDVATALLVSSAAALWFMARDLGADPSPEAARYYLRIHGAMGRVALLSIAWIVLGGIPRTIFFERFEWANAAGKLQVPALVAKHVLIFALVGVGLWGWSRLRRRAREIRAGLGAG